MKVQKVVIKNFKILENVESEVNGKPVYLIGGNGKGKTTFIQAMYSALTGESLPPNPITNGKDKGNISVTIGDENERYIVEISFSKANPKGTLSVRNTEDGPKLSSPRSLLENIVGRISFDPFDFLNLDTKKQVKFIKELVGIDFTALDAEYKRVETERTDKNRDIKSLEGSISERSITEHEIKLFTEEKDITALQKEVEEASKHNSKIGEGRARIENYKREVEYEEQAIKSIEAEINSLEERIKTYRAEQEQKRESIADKKLSITSGEAWLVENKERDLTALNNKVRESIAFNTKVKAVQSVKTDMEKLGSLKQYSKELTNQLRDIEERKRQTLAETKMPVEGLGFTEDYLTLDGLPFEESQISTSRIIKTGIEIMMATNPKLKICRIKNCSLLDTITFNELITAVTENGFQPFVEIVQHDGEQLEVQLIEE